MESFLYAHFLIKPFYTCVAGASTDYMCRYVKCNKVITRVIFRLSSSLGTSKIVIIYRCCVCTQYKAYIYL